MPDEREIPAGELADDEDELDACDVDMTEGTITDDEILEVVNSATSA